MKGLFITLEGVEGSGKSTQARLLKDHLEGRGHRVLLTREPGGTPLAEKIREIVLNPMNNGLGVTAELLLYEAARAQHVHELVRPALDEGVIVVSDRYIDSTTAYQGAGRQMDLELVKRLHAIATGGLLPDLTFLLDLPVEEGLRRATAGGKRDRIEQEPVEFHERVRQGFLQLAREEPVRIRKIDGLQPSDVVAKEIAIHVTRLLDDWSRRRR